MNKKEIKNKKSWRAPQVTNLDGSDTAGGIIATNETMTFPTMGGGTVRGSAS